MLVEMELCEVLRNADTNAIVLRDKKNGKRFPVFIGQGECEALEISLMNLKHPRPLTHDLILNVIDGLGGTLTRVIIDKLEKNTFFGKLDIRRQDNSSVWIDSRPSDAVVIASKKNVRIFCDQSILDGIGENPPEHDLFEGGE